MKLSLLIPTTPDREHFMVNLRAEIDRQIKVGNYQGVVQYIEYSDNYENSIGAKRNRLYELAQGDYVASLDSDDRISPNYIKLQMEGILKGVDCNSLTGEITFDGINPKPFIHSIMYDRYWEDEKAYYRYPNNLNAIRASIAKQFKFPVTKHEYGNGNHGEDTNFATQIFKSGLLKTEHYIPEILYYYDYRSKK